MSSAAVVEQYCTLLDATFLPQLLALHASLKRHASPFRLWIICLDEETRTALELLALHATTLIPVSELESQALLAVKPQRLPVEYCWTLTPFVFDAVFQREPDAGRVTYLDSDLFFFRSPEILIAEFEQSGKDVLVTEHAYAPEYDQTATSGRFCVQFLTFTNSGIARQIRSRWQAQCLEWCFARPENGKFGDQRYLDEWPNRFGSSVHIYSEPAHTVAPWNVRHLAKRGNLNPVFFHFHGVRLLTSGVVLLQRGYRIGGAGAKLYSEYLREFRASIRQLRVAGIPVRTADVIRSPLDVVRLLRSVIQGEAKVSVV